MSRIPSVAFFVLLAGAPPPQIATYEGDIFPDEAGWERITFCTPERSLHNGWLVQQIDAPGQCNDPPNGDQDLYTISLANFDREVEFFFDVADANQR